MSLLKRIERARPAAEGEGAERPGRAPSAAAGSSDPERRPPPPAGRRHAAANRPFLGALPARESFREAKFRVQNRLINELDPKLDLTNQVEVRRQIEELFGKIADEEGLALTRAERVRMLEQITDEILGLGPMEPLLRDETITEVMVNGPQQVYIEREGRLELTNVTFQNDEHVMKIIQRIIAPIGRRIDESSPMVDARLADGSRVNAIIPPLSLVGPVITIRKFSATPFTVEDLVRFGTATPEMFEFLEACVKARLNIFVSGGTGSGKTTMLNILSSFIPDDERIVTIEDAAELQLRQEHVVTLEARPSNIEGKGAIPIRELVRNALRMRPDRIVVGECRSGRGAGHAAGHEHRPRRLDVDRPRQHAARHALPPRDDGADGRHGPAAEGHPRADRIGRRPDRPPEPPQGWIAQDRGHHRGAGHGGRRHRHAGHLRVRADGRDRGQDPGQAAADRASAPSSSRSSKWQASTCRRTSSARRSRRRAEHMLPILIAGLAAGAVLLISVGIAMSGGSGGVASRLERYARSGGDAAGRRRCRQGLCR